MAFTFTHPYYLFFLVLLPLIAFLHFYLLKVKRGVAVQFSNFEALARIKGLDLYSKNLVLVFITMAAVLLVILALSGLVVQREVSSSEFSYVLTIDSSQSMGANDMAPSRLDVAKQTAENFVDKTPSGTEIAVMSFSGSALIEQQITIDKTQINEAIKGITLSSIGGTDLYEAIVSSSNMLQSQDSKSVILISDGQLNIGNLQDAINYAVKNNVVIHTLGVGTEEGGQTSYGISTIDEQSLQAVAFGTGGKYFRVTSATDFANSMDSILAYKLKNVSFDMTQYLLIASLILIIFSYILANTRYKVMP